MIFEADREIHPLQLKNSLKIISFLVLVRWHLYMTIKSQWKEYFAGPLIIDTWCWLLLVYVFPTVPPCLSWELLGYLVPCTLGRSYLSDRSQLVAVYGVTSYPVPVFHWPLIWAYFFSSSTWMTFVSLTLPPIVHLFCMLMTPPSITLFPNHPMVRLPRWHQYNPQLFQQ